MRWRDGGCIEKIFFYFFLEVCYQNQLILVFSCIHSEGFAGVDYVDRIICELFLIDLSFREKRN